MGNVKWNNRQLVIVRAVVHGNIVDLVNDAMSARKDKPPHGHRQFATAHREASIPLEYIGNPRVKLIVVLGAVSLALLSETHRTTIENLTSDVEEQEGSSYIFSTPKSGGRLNQSSNHEPRQNRSLTQ